MIKSSETVSICIPTYNHGPFIGRMLESLRVQTYPCLDIVVSDNASTDQTRDVVLACAARDRRIRYFCNPRNVGGENFNCAIKRAAAPVIALFHSDDIYEPTIVEEELAALAAHPGMGAVFSLDTIIDEDDRFVSEGVQLEPELADKPALDFRDVFNGMLRRSGSFLVCSTFMARRDVLDRMGEFADTKVYGDLGGAGDTDMWLRIAQQYPIGIVRKRLIRRRVSMRQGSPSYDIRRLTRAKHFLVMESFLRSSRSQASPGALKQYEFNLIFDDLLIAKNCIKSGDFRRARALLYGALKLRLLLHGMRNLRNFSALVLFVFESVSVLAHNPRINDMLLWLIKRARPGLSI